MTKPSKGKIRCVNLTFQPPQYSDGHTHNEVPNNGFRPHGGNRGTKKHPHSQYSYAKSAEYHRKLREDIDKLFDEENKEKNQTPRWAHEVNKESSHSGENPLFSNKHMSPKKQEQHMEYIRLAQALLEENRSKISSRSSAATPAYHRANSAHQFMEATDMPIGELDSKLGRPTRTTLLRNRQRTASAPLTSYEIRKEAKRKAQELLEQRSRPATAAAHKEILFMPSVEKGDTPHAFLTGARYNRAHYLDSKSLHKYGVYMPRDNPLGTFINQKPKSDMPEKPETPAAPPSPADTPIPERVDSRPCTPAQRPMTPMAKGRQAWTAESTLPQQQNDSSRINNIRETSWGVHEPGKSNESLGGEQGLNITGHRLGGLSAPSNTPRVRSPTNTSRMSTKSPLPNSPDIGIIPPRDLPPSRGLPVCVGKSIYGMPLTPEAIRHTSMANQPRSSPILSARDVAEKLNVDILNVEAEMSDVRLEEREERSPVRDEVIAEEAEEDDNQMEGADEPGQDAVPEADNQQEEAQEPATEEAAGEETPMQEDEEVAEEISKQETLEEEEGKANDELEVESCGQAEQIPDDNVEFFLTEEGGEKLVDNGGVVEEPTEISSDAQPSGKADVLNVLMEEEQASVVGSDEMSAASGQDTAREPFVPVISVDISRKSTESMKNEND